MPVIPQNLDELLVQSLVGLGVDEVAVCDAVEEGEVDGGIVRGGRLSGSV
jgi:hypothetical protein